jgi:outer membrane protein assembly factor BamB
MRLPFKSPRVTRHASRITASQNVILTLAFLSGTILGCASRPTPPQTVPAIETTVWRGEVHLTESVTFPRGSRLVLEPGTVVRFANVDEDGDGWGDVSLRVEGDLLARGTPQEPILFTTADTPPAAGSWGEVRVDFGAFEFRHAVIEGSTRGVHAHFSRGTIRDCVLRWNVDGTRLGDSEVAVEHNLLYGHQGKAYNARSCRNALRNNRFHHNRNAVFLFEADRGSVFEGNHFRDNRYSLRLGDFFTGQVTTRGNDWGDTPPAGVELAAGQAVDSQPAPVVGAGPRAWPHWDESWATRFGGFVDSAPIWTDEGIYVAAWDGEVARLGFLDGSRLDSASLPDTVDAALAIDGDRMAAQCWDRGVYLLERENLRVISSFQETPSPADDHRQAAPLFLDGTLFAATWAGNVHAFDPTGEMTVPVWTFGAQGPFRAALTAMAGLLLAPCSDGTLYALDPRTGRPRWTFEAGNPLLSAAASDGARAYLADRDGKLHAVELADGRGAWRLALPGQVWYAPPLLHDGILYQGDDTGTVTAVHADNGTVSWSRSLDGGVRARPAAFDGNLLAIPTLAGRYYLLDARTGAERDCWLIEEGAVASPAARGATAVFGGRDGVVRSLRVVVEAAAAGP